MEIRKIASFTHEEIEALTRAGAVLGAVAKNVVAGEVDGLDQEATQLVNALRDVLGRITVE